MLIARDEVRQLGAVQAFDHTQKLAEYGFEVGTLGDLAKARDLVAAMVSDAETEINALITAHRELDQNPYKPTVAVGGAEIKYAMEVRLFDANELTHRIDQAFSSEEERATRNRPKNDVLGAKIKRELTKLAEAAHYEVVAIDKHDDGSPARIVLRDPDYAREATAREPKPPALAELGSLLAASANESATSLSREALGCSKTTSSEALTAVRNAALAIVEESVAKVADHIAASRSAQLSPFNREPARLTGEILYCNEAFVRRSGFKRTGYVDRPVVIALVRDRDITWRLRSLVDTATHQAVEDDKFRSYVRAAIAARLSAVEGLPLACISYHRADSGEPLRAVLTDPTLSRTPSLWQRVMTLGRAKEQPVRALPAPARAAEVVPPVSDEPAQRVAS